VLGFYHQFGESLPLGKEPKELRVESIDLGTYLWQRWRVGVGDFATQGASFITVWLTWSRSA
jgi:hypothetical protein